MDNKNHEIDEELSIIKQIIMDADYLGEENLDESIKYLEVYGRLSEGVSPHGFHIYDKLASIHLNQAYNPIKAATYTEKSLQIHQQHKGADSVEVVDCYLKIGHNYSLIGLGEKSVLNYKSALGIIKTNYCSESEFVADLYRRIASDYWIDIKDYPTALEYLTLSVETYHALEDDLYYEELADNYSIMGLLHGYLLDYDASIACYKKSIELLTKAFGVGDYNTITNYEPLATKLIETNNYEEAMEYLEKSLELKVKVCPNWVQVGILKNKIALVYEKQFDYVDALDNYQEALKIFEALEERKSVEEEITAVTESIKRIEHLMGR